jgi:DNA-directed RNA polymerase subunit RPC12/RpoP
MATAKGKGRRVPPSRRRYEATHRTVSARLDLELQHELDLLKSKSGMSTSDVTRVGLDKATPAIEEAFKRGYEESERRFRVIYLCSGCGEQTLSIGTKEQKEAAAELMHQDGWYCPRCR